MYQDFNYILNDVLIGKAASGAGAAAMEELRAQTRDVLDGKPAVPKIFPTQASNIRDNMERLRYLSLNLI